MNEMDGSVVQKREAWFIPGAIIAAGIVLALGIYIERSGHVEGSAKADITLMLVEYADIDSTYSKSFQQTMEELMAQYAEGGKVAWVYRHLPLIDQHIHAAEHAEAAECIASLGGPNIFFRFIDALNSASPGDLQFDPKNYDSVVSSLGVLPESFDACLSAHTYQNKVGNDFQNGIAIGAGGSPFTVLLVKGQKPVTIDGALPYDGLKKIVDQAISMSATSTAK
jgi:protein-disulfide isomerase